MGRPRLPRPRCRGVDGALRSYPRNLLFARFKGNFSTRRRAGITTPSAGLLLLGASLFVGLEHALFRGLFRGFLPPIFKESRYFLPVFNLRVQRDGLFQESKKRAILFNLGKKSPGKEGRKGRFK